MDTFIWTPIWGSRPTVASREFCNIVYDWVITGNMSLNHRADASWNLIVTSDPNDMTLQETTNFLAPVPGQPSQVPLCLRALLPMYNYNRMLVRFLDACPVGMFARHTIVAGVFGADCFFPFADITRAFERHSIELVANFPTIVAYGQTVGNTLADVGLGFDRECDTLSRFRQRGFKTAMTIRHADEKTLAESFENFALIELAQSENQVFSKLFGQQTMKQRMFLTPNGRAPISGQPPNVDGLILAA